MDGKPDYAVGNLGLNTPYRPVRRSSSHGQASATAASPLILEATEENGQLDSAAFPQ